jgi:hypothetical protein
MEGPSAALIPPAFLILPLYLGLGLGGSGHYKFSSSWFTKIEKRSSSSKGEAQDEHWVDWCRHFQLSDVGVTSGGVRREAVLGVWRAIDIDGSGIEVGRG